MTVRNSAIIFLASPTGFPIPGEHLIYKDDAVVDLENVALNGGILAKTLSLGIDVYLRNRMPWYTPGAPLLGFGIGRVLRSDNPSYKVGDHIYASDYPFQEYAVMSKEALDNDHQLRVVKNEAGLPWSNYLSALGLPGQTAWVGYKALANAKKGETIYVSTGAGTVGSIVCQVAKAQGLKVIASTGSDEKVKYLTDELAVDVAFNYKTQEIGDVLKEHGSIDIYWDSVGGKALETVMDHMNKWGRVIICGFISGYNTTEAYGIKNTGKILIKNLTVSGYVVFDLMDRYGLFDFYPSVTQLIKEGRLNVAEQISVNLRDAPQLLLDMQTGKNTGKPIINLAAD